MNYNVQSDLQTYREGYIYSADLPKILNAYLIEKELHV